MNTFFQDFDSNIKLIAWILESVSEGILIADVDTIVHYVNSAYLRITGIKSDEIIGKKVSEVRKGAQLPLAIEKGITLQNIKRHVNGVEYIVSLSPIIFNGKIVGGITIARDMTQINQLVRQVKKYTEKIEQLEHAVKSIYQSIYSFEDIIGESEKLKRCKNISQKMALSDMNIMIRGESGTGKELFAHAIHNYSHRASNPFVAVNCAAIPKTLFLSELFGYEPGAFTGASKKGKAGLFEIANGGTLFLDEIGDLDLGLQSDLLRVLETNEYFKIGATTPTIIDVRIIAATNKNLEYLIENKKFRDDLYFRLNVVPINIPPLRERKEDISLLIKKYLSKTNLKTGRNVMISSEAMKCLENYDWPGNVRQLKHALDFAYFVSSDNMIDIKDLPIELQRRINEKASSSKKRQGYTLNLNTTVEIAEKNRILELMELYGKSLNGKKQVAAQLGISLSTLYNKINKYGIKK